MLRPCNCGAFLIVARITDIYNMCGIAGIIAINSQQVTVHRLQQMTDALAHRGPDGEDQWVNKTAVAGLGHRRLAIIDLSPAGAQPMHYLGRYTIVHNGEIYNYIELRAELEQKGYGFASHSDTEVLLAAYDCWKENCLQYLDGMFAFAIWDEKEQRLFAARDRFGEKPFYYHFSGEALFFASEMKALWAAGVPRQVNEPMLFNFITLGYAQNPGNAAETAFKHICKLPAATYFVHNVQRPGSIKPIVYWEINARNTNNTITTAQAIVQFSTCLQQSVEKRLRSDVVLGTSLSGGLDSSSIAVIIKELQQNSTSLQTFSAVFPGSAADESQYIQLLAKQQVLENFTVNPTAAGFINDFEKLCYHQEGFIGSASVYAQFKVFELARLHGVKVLLDGQGADETLAGYHKYYHWYWQELYATDRESFKGERLAAGKLGIQQPWSWQNKLAARFPSAAATYTKSNRQKKQLHIAGIDPAFIESNGISYYQLPAPDRLSNVLHYNTFTNGLEELLQYADRNAMAHGCEVRLPFLQHQLVAFVFSLPARFKIQNGYTKWILRKAMESRLPPAINWRVNKIGFEPPQQQWMQHAGVQDYIINARKKMAAAGILDKSFIDKKIQPQDSHAADNFDWRCLAAGMLLY